MWDVRRRPLELRSMSRQLPLAEVYTFARPMPARSPWLARLAGDPLRAGDLYYQQGKLGAAAAMYRRAKRFDQAARVQLELGDRKAALELYLEAGDHLRAGELLAQNGDHRDAIPHFENARAYVKAAE